jgi:hypothetical protein
MRIVQLWPDPTMVGVKNRRGDKERERGRDRGRKRGRDRSGRKHRGMDRGRDSSVYLVAASLSVNQFYSTPR